MFTLGLWGDGDRWEAQDTSAGSGSGHLEIPSDILNDRKLSERVCTSGDSRRGGCSL